MKKYDFTLDFRLPSATELPEIYVERLEAKGCDDALIGIGQKGCIALNFIRAAASASDAVTSAITQVREAIPNVRLTEITPDFVDLSDVAELLGFTHQDMLKIMVSSGARFPEPVHEGKPSIWHLANILIWLKNQELHPVAEELVELAEINMQLNLVQGSGNNQTPRRAALRGVTNEVCGQTSFVTPLEGTETSAFVY